MKRAEPFSFLPAIALVALLASCAKEEAIAPASCGGSEEVPTKALMNDDPDPADRPISIEAVKGDGSPILRGGGVEEGGDGGISDDGDDEADGERNKKDEH